MTDGSWANAPAAAPRREWTALAAVLPLAVGLAALIYFLLTARSITHGVTGAPLDDTWIHFQFARNLSQGYGFSYNPGEPTPGSTAPLWTVVLAGFNLLTADLMPVALGLSAFFLLATVALTVGFTRWVTTSLWAAALAGVAVALTGRWQWAGLAGMETTAFGALSLAGIWAAGRRGLGWFPALLFGLAAQLRPEGHALFALALADAAWAFWRDPTNRNGRFWRRAARTFLPPLAIYALLSLPYVLFSLSTTGRPLPNTFYAKVGAEQLFSWRTLQETLAYHWQDNPVSLILLLFGLWPLWQRSRLAVLWLLGLPLLTAIVIDTTWHHGRYTMPLIPLQMAAAATGAHWLATEAAGRLRTSASAGALPAILGLLLLVAGAWRLPAWAAMLGTNTQEIEDIDVALGRWLAANTAPDALIAVDDIGAIAYLSGRRIVDMNGLVSPEVWPALAQPEGLPRDQVMTRILSQSRPATMAAFPLWRWNIVTNPDVARELHHVHTDTHTIIFQQDAYVYATEWPYIATANPHHPGTARFGDAIRLAGHDLAAGNPLSLTLYWESLEAVGADYDVFVHILDQAGAIVAQTDREPAGGLAPTSLWQPGDLIRDRVPVALPPDLPAGVYEVRVGLYQRETGARLPVSEGPWPDALSLGTIQLP